MKPKIIGMIHLLPLPGYSKHPGMNIVIKQALEDLAMLESGGVSAVLVENENDHPHQVKASPEIIAAMTLVVNEIVKQAKVSVGVEVLLNDPQASLAIAKITGAKFIRTDYFVDKMWRSNYGELEKGKTISQSVKQAIKAGADAVIITGKISGQAPQLKDLKEAKQTAGKFPVYVGSGFSIDNAQKLLPFCDGAIVGTSLKTKGKLDINKVKKLCQMK